MNEDILLTNKSPEIVKIVQEYWGAPIILDQDDLEIIIEEVCRAQVRKVMEWMDTICTDERHPFSNPDYYGDTPRRACPDCLRTLREAAGEGK